MTPKFDTVLDKTPISWKKLMALRETGKDTFESLTPAWPPAPFKRTFGGHVYAQAVYAASKTISPGFFVHVSHPSIFKIKKTVTPMNPMISPPPFSSQPPYPPSLTYNPLL